MARIRIAKVQSIIDFPDAATRLLTLACDTPLDFRGGMWMMVDLGVTLPNGRSAKRAYSIISSDKEQQSFQVAVKHIDTEHTSAAMHRLKTGETFSFSGPYGKQFRFPLPEELAVAGMPPTPAVAGTLATGKKIRHVGIIATDTGITAILGIFQSEALRLAMVADPAIRVTIIWLVQDENNQAQYFLPLDFVQKICPHIHIRNIPPPHALDSSNNPLEKRLARAVAGIKAVEQEFRGPPLDTLFLSGDGWLIQDLLAGFFERDELQPVAEMRMYQDIFFHQAQKATEMAQKK